MAVIRTDKRYPEYEDTQMNGEHRVDGNTGIQPANEYQLLHLLRMSAASPPTAQLASFFQVSRNLLYCLDLLSKRSGSKFVPIKRDLFWRA